MLPPEAVLAENAGVSRLTAREAIRSLQAQKIVSVRRGLGTFVNSPSVWSSLDATLRAAAHNLGGSEVPLRLLEVRRIVETGSAELAACNHQASDLVSLDAMIAEMEAAYENGDLDRLTRNGLAFHDIIAYSECQSLRARPDGSAWRAVVYAAAGDIRFHRGARTRHHAP